MGGFDLAAVTQGRLAMFNMWDRELTLAELQNHYCQTQGNLLTVMNLTVAGPADLKMMDVPCEACEWLRASLSGS